MTSDELRFVMEKIIRLVSVQFCTFFCIFEIFDVMRRIWIRHIRLER